MVILVAVAGVVYFGADRGARCVELCNQHGIETSSGGTWFWWIRARLVLCEIWGSQFHPFYVGDCEVGRI